MQLKDKYYVDLTGDLILVNMIAPEVIELHNLTVDTKEIISQHQFVDLLIGNKLKQYKK